MNFLRNGARQGIAMALAAMLFAVLSAVAAADDAVVNGATSCREWTALRAGGNAAAEKCGSRASS